MYNSQATFTINGWDATKYRGFFRAVPVGAINLQTRPLPIFTFVGDDICIVYSPTYQARIARTKLFGTVGQAARFVPIAFEGGEGNWFEAANTDVKVLVDGNVLNMFAAPRFGEANILGYFRDDGREISGGEGTELTIDSPMWWMAPAGGFLRCTVREPEQHHALVKFGHPYHHEATHQASKPVTLGPGADVANNLVVEVIRVTVDDTLYLATYSYYAIDEADYTALSGAADAAAAEVLLAGMTTISNLRDHVMQLGAASGLVHLRFSAMNEGARLGLTGSLVDYLYLTDEQTGEVFNSEGEEPAGKQYGGVWHDFDWLTHASDWQSAPAVPHTTVSIDTSLDVMDFDGQLLHITDAGVGYIGYGGPFICPDTGLGLAPLNQLVLTSLEPPDTTATIFRPGATFVLYNLT